MDPEARCALCGNQRELKRSYCAVFVRGALLHGKVGSLPKGPRESSVLDEW